MYPDYSNIEFIKAAVRICKKTNNNADPLVVNVALCTDRITKNYSLEEKKQIEEMVSADIKGYFTLPFKNNTYPKDRWDGIYYSILSHPVTLRLEEKAKIGFNKLCNEIYSEKIINSVIESHWYYFIRNSALSAVPHYPFSHGGDEERWPHTPETLKQFLDEAVKTLEENTEPFLDLLLDPVIYSSSTSPDEIIEKFRPYKRSFAINILKRIHHINFGFHNDATGRIEAGDLWEGKTIADVRRAEQLATKESNARFAVMNARQLQGLKLFSDAVSLFGNHPATLSKKLKSSGSNIRLVTARSQYSSTSHIDFGNGYIFPSDHYLLSDVIDDAIKAYEKLNIIA